MLVACGGTAGDRCRAGLVISAAGRGYQSPTADAIDRMRCAQMDSDEAAAAGQREQTRAQSASLEEQRRRDDEATRLRLVEVEASERRQQEQAASAIRMDAGARTPRVGATPREVELLCLQQTGVIRLVNITTFCYVGNRVFFGVTFDRASLVAVLDRYVEGASVSTFIDQFSVRHGAPRTNIAEGVHWYRWRVQQSPDIEWSVSVSRYGVLWREMRVDSPQP